MIWPTECYLPLFFQAESLDPIFVHDVAVVGAGPAGLAAAVYAASEGLLTGIFAVGDVRSGSVKRVASAVGEGSVVVTAIHEYIGSCGND